MYCRLNQNVKAAIGLLLLVAGTPEFAQAQVFETVGTRALGMGGAFVAMADDASSVYWNPAGMAEGPIVSMVADWSSGERTVDGQQGRGLSTSGSLTSLTMPALGLSYLRSRQTTIQAAGVSGPSGAGADAGELIRPGDFDARSLVTHHAGVTLTQSVLQSLVAGTTVRFVRGVATNAVLHGIASPEEALDQVERLIGRASGAIDADFGALLSFGYVRAGVVLRHAFEPSFETFDGVELREERQVRLGAAVRLTDLVILAADADVTTTPSPLGRRRAVAFGVEGWTRARRLGVRGGVRAHTIDTARTVAAAGVSVAVWRTIAADAQGTFGADDSDRGWSVAARVTF
jgi:hypothetical protein